MLKLLMVFLFFFAQMGLLTSFHILFDMPKEDIGNSSQSEGERERGQKGYLSRQIVSNETINSLASKQSFIIPSFLERPSFHTTCTVLYLLYLTFPSSNRGKIVYCILIESDECPRVTKASKPVNLSLNLSPITKQILILTRLVSELRDSISPPSYHCDHGLDSGILQLDYLYPC